MRYSLPLEDADKENWRDYTISMVDYLILPDLEIQGLVITPDDQSVAEIGLPAALNMVVWIALTAFFLLFVLPYLILGGWGRGIFYIIVLGLSFALENRLTLYAPTWFSLSPNGLSRVLFVAFFVFVNALFFDWLFDTITNRKKACPACKLEMDKVSLYCSQCGFQQE
jgi:hypothetical protein